MAAIERREPKVEFIGVGGVTMLKHGMCSLADIDHFAVNGFVDPLLRIVSLVRLLRNLIRELSTVDVVVGVDFNVFNLLLERGVRKRGVPTAHYVSPSVYAWRRGRLKQIGEAADVVMTLFPFETAVYDEANIRAVFVGHPTADRFDADSVKHEIMVEARTTAGWPHDAVLVCLMPGSRGSEIRFHLELFLETAQRFQSQIPTKNIKFVMPVGHSSIKEKWFTLRTKFPQLDLEITDAGATLALAASDIALVKSGTSTLEAMLLKTPMVVAYRMGTLTAWVIRKLMFIDHVALPNILANRVLVPEFLQNDATAANLANALSEQFQCPPADLMQTFTHLHRTLKQDAASRAADAVLSLVASR